MFDALIVPAFYGAVTIIAIILAWKSEQHVVIKLGLLLFLAWVACNVAVKVQGFSHAPLLIPSIDAVIAVCVAGLALANRDLVAAAVFALYLVVGVIHVYAFSTHAQGTYPYYLALNLAYLGQVVVVGGAGGRAYLANRTPSRHSGAHAHPLSG